MAICTAWSNCYSAHVEEKYIKFRLIISLEKVLNESNDLINQNGIKEIASQRMILASSETV